MTPQGYQPENFDYLDLLTETVDGELVGRGPMAIPPAVLTAAGHGPRETRSIVAAMGNVGLVDGLKEYGDLRRQCLACVEGPKAVRDCEIIDCPIWPYCHVGTNSPRQIPRRFARASSSHNRDAGCHREIRHPLPTGGGGFPTPTANHERSEDAPRYRSLLRCRFPPVRETESPGNRTRGGRMSSTRCRMQESRRTAATKKRRARSSGARSAGFGLVLVADDWYYAATLVSTSFLAWSESLPGPLVTSILRGFIASGSSRTRSI